MGMMIAILIINIINSNNNDHNYNKNKTFLPKTLSWHTPPPPPTHEGLPGGGRRQQDTRSTVFLLIHPLSDTDPLIKDLGQGDGKGEKGNTPIKMKEENRRG